MRIGTLFNIYKIIPKIMYDIRKEIPHIQGLPWFVEHTPKAVLRFISKLFNIPGDGKVNFNPRYFFNLERHIDELRKAGAVHFELSTDLMFLLTPIEEWWRAQMPYLTNLRAEGITYSEHLPQFAGMHFDTYLYGVRSGAVMDFRYIHAFSKDIDPVYVLHLGSERFFQYLSIIGDPRVQEEIEKFFGSKTKTMWGNVKLAAASSLIRKLFEFVQRFLIEEVVDASIIRSLGEASDIVPVNRIGIENLEHTDFDAVMPTILDRVPKCGVWLDTGHLMVQKWHRDKQCFEKFFEKYERHLIGMHIHNAIETAKIVYKDGSSQPFLLDHQPLDAPEGLLPLKKILELVRRAEKKINREIPLVIELYYQDPQTTLASVRFLKNAVETL